MSYPHSHLIPFAFKYYSLPLTSVLDLGWGYQDQVQVIHQRAKKFDSTAEQFYLFHWFIILLLIFKAALSQAF